MKDNGYFFEEKDFNQEQFNPLQILKAFQELNRSNKPNPSPTKNIVITGTQSDNVRPNVHSKQAEPISSKSKLQADSLPKKTYIIKKPINKQVREEASLRNQHSLGHVSNLSKSHDIAIDSLIEKRKESVCQYNFSKKNTDLGDKEINNLKLCGQISDLEAKYAKRQQQYAHQKLKLMHNCDKLLQQSITKKLQFQQFLNNQNYLKQCIYQQQLSQKYETQMHFLLSEQSKLKGKRGKKSQQTEQQQTKNCELMNKKGYVSYLLNKLGKEKEKYGSIKYNQNQPILSELSKNRIQQLKKFQSLNNYSLLSLIQGGRQNVEVILCMDMNRLQECTIECLKFSPILPKNKRSQLFESFRQINALAKRLTFPSPNIFFPNKANVFLPISKIFSSEEQIFIVNEHTQKYNMLCKFLNRIQFSSGDQGLGVLKYILNICLRIVEQLEQQIVKFSAIVLPKCIYVNEKFQVKFKNVIFNQLLYHHFKHLLLQDERYFFPPEQNPEPQAAIFWSIGILAYYFYFASKPFSKYNPYNWPSRQYFFAANEIQYQNKLPANEKIRQFVGTCLMGKMNTKGKLQICLDLLSNLHVK